MYFMRSRKKHIFLINDVLLSIFRHWLRSWCARWMIKSSFGGMYEWCLSVRAAHTVWCGNMCHVICKYRTFLTLMETPGPEAPHQGNEGMANCTQTVHKYCTHSGRQNGKQFIINPFNYNWTWYLVLRCVMLIFRLCSPSVVMFRLSPDQYQLWLGGGCVLVYWGRVSRVASCHTEHCTMGNNGD